MLGTALTDPANASVVFLGGVVAYSNAAKVELLQVSEATLSRVGAVSEEVAAEMAAGAADRLGADVAVSITGIAGPGGSEAKPEGRVCFALHRTGARGTSETVEFGPLGRARVRSAATEHALGLLLGGVERPDWEPQIGRSGGIQ
jgi:nicotinamide-nucleotide amidase